MQQHRGVNADRVIAPRSPGDKWETGGEHRGQGGKTGENMGKKGQKTRENMGEKRGEIGESRGKSSQQNPVAECSQRVVAGFFSYLTHFHAKVRLCELCLISVHFLYFTFNFTLFSPHFLIFFTRVSIAFFLKPSQAELLYFCERREVSHDSNHVHRINSAKLCFVLFPFFNSSQFPNLADGFLVSALTFQHSPPI